MNWKSLLSSQRLRRPNSDQAPARNPFQQDLDRIVFSNAFRRLANKTQVHPLAPNDHIHTRLTHSIEVASVGRSLGGIIGGAIAARLKDPSITADQFGDIVQAACLAHDIGNPPFGHAGEDAIRLWFERAPAEIKDALSGARREDFRSFEGNAQGFRIISQLENNKLNGGLQLTYAVLGTFTKYPRGSVLANRDAAYIGEKKIGFFDAERAYFDEVATGLGLIRRRAGDNAWCRHPLAFLVEAADDICYGVVDIEDGYQLGYMSYAEARDVLFPIAGDRAIDASLDNDAQVAKLRAVAISNLIRAASKAFLDNETALLAGTQSDDLLNLTEFGAMIAICKAVAKRKIYWSDRKTRLETAGTEVIRGLLDIFSDVVMALDGVGYDVGKLGAGTQRLVRLMGSSLHKVTDTYSALLCVTDFVSGMTDRYAVDTYRTLKGISV